MANWTNARRVNEISPVSCCSCVVPQAFTDGWYFVLVSYYFLPYFLDSSTKPHSRLPFPYFKKYSPIIHGWQSLSLHVPYADLSSQVFMFHALIGIIWVHSNADATLLVVFERPSNFLAAVICAVPNFFINLTFSSHTSPAFSSFGTIVFIRILNSSI